MEAVDLRTVETTTDWKKANAKLRTNIVWGYGSDSKIIPKDAISIFLSIVYLVLLVWTRQYHSTYMDIGIVALSVSMILMLMVYAYGYYIDLYIENNADKMFCGVVVERVSKRTILGTVSGRRVSYKRNGNWLRMSTPMSRRFSGYDVGDIVQLIEVHGTIRCVMNGKTYREFKSYD